MRKLLAVALLLAMLSITAIGAGAEARDTVRLAKEIVLELFEGEPAKVYERFAPEIADMMSGEELAALIEQITDEVQGVGAFDGIGEVRQGAAEIIVTTHFSLMDLLTIISFNDQSQITALYFLPDSPSPEDIPLEANEEMVEVGELKLPGILTVPEGEKLPAVVLVHGSGPNDRNESIGGTVIFSDIAKGLADQGIAVLRYDKRTYLMNQGTLPVTEEEIANLTVYDETVIDALAAVELLKADPRIDPERVFVIGHSQGAVMATCIQVNGAGAKGLILLAGTLRPIATLLAEQLEALDADTYAKEIEVAKNIKEMSEEEARNTNLLGQSAYMYWEQAQHDTNAYAEQANVPMLILQGKEDTQVFADRDYPLWEAFAQEHPDRDITLKLYDGLGHLFNVDLSFSQEVLNDMAAWILER